MTKLPYNPFPPLDEADEDGLLAVGGELSPQLLLLAYLQGIFPWPYSEKHPLTWFSPNPRGILAPENFHISKSFKRFLNNHTYDIRFNTNFELVMKKCAQAKRSSGSGTWITPKLTKAYLDLYHMGYAYCIEIYSVNQNLVGGLYGVCIDTIISGESMFHSEPNTSKLALYTLITRLKLCGIPYLDTQMVTPITKQLGATQISREQFARDLKKPRPNLIRSDLFK